MLFRKLTIDAVNRATTTQDGAAGKSVNVAKVLKALGERPLALGFLGGDRGEELRSILRERGVEMDFVPIAVRTRQCITVIDEAAGTHTELVEESQPVSASAYTELVARVRNHCPKSRAVIMSGSLTPGGPANFYFQCTQLGHEHGALTLVDAQGPPLLEALKAKPALVKPNRTELAATAGRELSDEADMLKAIRELSGRGAERVVVTAGKEPVLAFDGKRLWRVMAPRLTALNPIGSGDAFTAGLVWRLLRGDDLGEACRWACAAGAANALTLMAGELEKADVEKLVADVKLEPFAQGA